MYSTVLKTLTYFIHHSMMLRSIIQAAAIIAITIDEVIPQTEEESCETVLSEIRITKDEFDKLGRLMRTCNSNVFVSKCEGACTSEVQPNIAAPNGFLKECFCCRESSMESRRIHLNECFDPDGIPLTSGKLSQMEVVVREPTSCKCYKCGN